MKKKSFAILLAAALLLCLLPRMGAGSEGGNPSATYVLPVGSRQILRLQDSSDSTTIIIM